MWMELQERNLQFAWGWEGLNIIHEMIIGRSIQNRTPNIKVLSLGEYVLFGEKPIKS